VRRREGLSPWSGKPSIKPIKVGIGDKGYDDDEPRIPEGRAACGVDNPSEYQDVPMWRTHGVYRKEMERGYSKKTYHQRSKDETIFSIVKMTMGDEVRSVRTRAQNDEMKFKIISYNAARMRV
jgi:hypothetical protein